MKRKKTKKDKRPIKEQESKRDEVYLYAVIILFALLGLFIGYIMYQDFAGFKLQENGHYKKIENED